MEILRTVGAILVTFIVLPNAIALALIRADKKPLALGSDLTLLIAYALAPALASLILYLALLLAPHQVTWVYRVVVLVPFVLVATRYHAELPTLGRAYLVLLHRALRWRPNSLRRSLALFIGLVVLLVFLIGCFFPIRGYDALSHAYRGRAIATERSLGPVSLLEPDAAGFTSSSVYPPGLHCLYAWTYILRGSTLNDVPVRVVAPYYFLLLILLVLLWGDKLRPGSGVFAATLLAATPLLVSQSGDNSIDPLRILLLALGLYTFYLHSENRSATLAWTSSMALGLALFVHSMALIALPVAGLLCLGHCRTDSLFRRSVTGSAILGSAVVIGCLDFLRRIEAFGSWQAPLLYIPEPIQDLLARRGLKSLGGVLTRGVFSSFLRPDLYGLAAWLAVLAAVIWAIRRSDSSHKVLGYSLGCTFGIAALIMVIPSPSAPGYANIRYILTALPMAAVCGGLALDWAWGSWCRIVSGHDTQAATSIVARIFYWAGILGLIAGLALDPRAVELIFSTDHQISPALVARILALRALLLSSGGLAVLASGVLTRTRVRWALSLCIAGAFLLVAPFAGPLAVPPGTLGDIGQGFRMALTNPATRMLCFLTGAGLIGIAALRLLLTRLLAAELWISQLAVRSIPAAALMGVLVFSGLLSISPKELDALGGFGISTLAASDENKLKDLGFVSSVLWLNNQEGATYTLVTEDTYYFYYSTRPGLYWRDTRLQPFYKAVTLEEAVSELAKFHLTHAQISARTWAYPLFASSYLGQILRNPELATVVWESDCAGDTVVYSFHLPELPATAMTPH